MDADAKKSCPEHCPGCAKTSGPANPDSPSPDAGPDGPTGDRLSGWRLALAAAYVFLVPPAAAIVAVHLLGERWGDLKALAAGVVAAVALMAPAWRILRRGRSESEQEAVS